MWAIFTPKELRLTQITSPYFWRNGRNFKKNEKMSNKIFLSVLFLFACFRQAISQNGQDSVQINAEIEEVVVSEQINTNKDVATPHVSVSADQKDRLGANDVSDILKKIAGLDVKDYGGVGGLKVVSVRSLGAQHTGVNLDGIPLSDCQTGQIDLSRYSLEEIEQITLSIADNSNIFKNAKHFASASTIDMLSPKGRYNTQKYNLKTALKCGSFGLADGHLLYDHAISRRSSISFGASLLHSDGQYPYTVKNGKETISKKRRNSETNNMHTEATLRLNSARRGELTSKIYYYYSDRELPGGIILYTDDNKEQLKEKNFFFQTQYKNDWGKFKMMANAKFNWAASIYHDEKAYYPSGEINDNYYQREYYASTTILYRIMRGLRVSNATDYTLNNLNANTINCPLPRRHTLLNASNIQWQKARITATATILTSLYRDESKLSGEHQSRTKLTPTLSFAYWLVKNKLALRAGYKNSFRMPNFSELYFERTNTRRIDPEYAKQLNCGLTFTTLKDSLKPSLTLTADYYHNWIKDKIVAIPKMFVWTVINMGNVDINGLDLMANAQLPFCKKYSLTTMIGYSLQQAIDKTEGTSYYGDQIPYTPKHSASAALSLENPFANLSYQLSAIGKRYSLPQNNKENEIEAYAEHSISLYRSFKTKKWISTFRIDALNITNKQYEIIKYYPMQRRSFKLSITLKNIN